MTTPPDDLSPEDAARNLQRAKAAARVVPLHGGPRHLRQWAALRADGLRILPQPAIWDAWLPRGKLTILAGVPKVGKTYAAIALAAIISNGGTWPDGTPAGPPGDVVILSVEDDARELVLRLRAAGADLTRCHIIPGATDDAEHVADPSAGLRDVDELLGELPRPRLVIIDPLAAVLRRGGSVNDAGDVRQSLRPLVRLAARHRCAVLGLAHLTKGTAGRDAAERISGSNAWVQIPRVVLQMARVETAPDRHEVRLVRVAGNSSKPDCNAFALSFHDCAIEVQRPEPGDDGGGDADTAGAPLAERIAYIQFGEPLTGEPAHLLADTTSKANAGDEAGRVRAAADFLTLELQRGAQPTAHVMRCGAHDGHSRRAIAEARARLGVQAVNVSGTWHLELPGKASDAAQAGKRGKGSKASKASKHATPAPDADADAAAPPPADDAPDEERI